MFDLCSKILELLEWLHSRSLSEKEFTKAPGKWAANMPYLCEDVLEWFIFRLVPEFFLQCTQMLQKLYYKNDNYSTKRRAEVLPWKKKKKTLNHWNFWLRNLFLAGIWLELVKTRNAASNNVWTYGIFLRCD